MKNWHKEHKNRFSFTCKHCGTIFTRSRRKNSNKEPFQYCGMDCLNKVLGKRRIIQKTRHKTAGYVSIWQPEHHKAYAGRVREHIVVMEKKLGREITDEEIVHHVNYLEDDNREDNLELASSDKEHHKYHKKTRFLIKEFLREKNLGKELTDYIRKRYNFGGKHE